MFVPPMRAEDLLKIVLNDLLYPYGLVYFFREYLELW